MKPLGNSEILAEACEDSCMLEVKMVASAWVESRSV